MKIRDILTLKPEVNYILASGCQRYKSAVVASMNPFVLVSFAGDMLWKSTVKPEYFDFVGIANDEIFDKVMKRWDSENKQ